MNTCFKNVCSIIFGTVEQALGQIQEDKMEASKLNCLFHIIIG